MPRDYWIKTNVTGNYFWLILIFKQYQNANNANFGCFEKHPLTHLRNDDNKQKLSNQMSH